MEVSLIHFMGNDEFVLKRLECKDTNADDKIAYLARVFDDDPTHAVFKSCAATLEITPEDGSDPILYSGSLPELAEELAFESDDQDLINCVDAILSTTFPITWRAISP